MDGRAVFATLLLALLIALSGCLPQPEKKIEWVQRPDSIIVQMKDVGGLPQPEAMDRATVPDFTLYGDGTLIFTQPSERGQFSRLKLLQAKLSQGDVHDLLTFVVDKGFLNFNYDQPRLGVYDFPTTFLYLSTNEAANAVSAYAIDSVLPENAGKEWNQFRKLEEIKSRRDSIANAVLADSATTAYAPDSIALTVERTPAVINSSSPEWPFPDIDLNSIAPDTGVGEQRIEGDVAREVVQRMTPISAIYFSQDGQIFSVGYRAALPYEENFPEFEGP